MIETVPLQDATVREEASLLPVVEIFGPTVQGEGPDAGTPAYFVRFGGCDFRCSWCDSMYAVDPVIVKAEARRLSPAEIVAELKALPAGPQLIVLTGGNPVMFDLARLVGALHEHDYGVAVETQGSVWRDWLASVDRLVISPKPPSSGMASDEHRAMLAQFMERSVKNSQRALKIVIFDEQDLEWTRDVARDYAGVPLYLSAGTDVGLSEDETLEALRARFRWLCEAVSSLGEFASARVLPQLHVVAWGTKRGV
jgi:7-carboxy-7-deazaguanine synthase